MKPSIALQSHREQVRNIALSHRVKNVRVFGSALHGNDTDESDLDLLVDPTPDTTLMDIGAIRFELRKLLGVPVDVLTPKALPEKFRNRVIEEARPI
jgi:predicted nucleotidyltransferase